VTATSTTIERILKELYPDRRLEHLLYEDQPFLGMVKKNTEFEGDSKRISLIQGGIAGRSALFATAQGNAAGTQYEGFNIRHKTDYAIFGITTLALRQSKTSKGALVNALNTETKTAITKLKQSISRGLWGNGGGAVGQIASGGGTTDLVLSNPDDIVNFEVGDYIQHATTDGTSGSLGAGAQQRISAINRDTGTLTFAGAVPASFADGQYLFLSGDFGIKLSGVRGWIPDAAPTSTAFNGVDRTAGDVTRLAGLRYTAEKAVHGTLQRALVKAGSRLRREGGKPDSCWMNPLDFAVALNDIGDKTRFVKTPGKSMGGGKASIAYDGLQIMLGSGPVTIYEDKDVPKGRCFLLQMDTWELNTAGKAPSWLDEDGKMFLRQGSADGLEGRMAMYGDLACYAPGYNMSIDISEFSED
jgi:hypothetical protein